MSESWSYSKLSSYEQCPHAYMYERIVKLEKPTSWHLTNGNYTHSLAENYLLGKIAEVPKELAKFKTEFENLKKHNAIPEEALVLDSKWQLLGNEDAWLHNDAWLRLKIDATVSDDYIIDFKTGKKYDEHEKQAKLYATVKMMLNTDLDMIEVEFWYLSLGETEPYIYQRVHLEQYKAEFEGRVDIMFNDTTFEPRPHKYCNNCFVKNLCNAYK
jgi:CRISPR/Cas system-associated exonuclease Cas4 (RecB family)